MLVHRVMVRDLVTMDELDMEVQFEDICKAMDLIDEMYVGVDRTKVRIYVKTIMVQDTPISN